MKTITIICIIIALIVAISAIILIPTVRHCPRRKISDDMRKALKQYGLVHFTLQGNVKDILSGGLTPDNSKKMSWLEKDMVWTYINRPGSYEANLKEVRTKGCRKDYDAAIFIRGLTDEQIDRMLQRRDTNVIVHVGVLKTADMVAQQIK